MPWILNAAYLFLLLAVSPMLLYRRLVYGKYRDGLAQKLLGQLPSRDSSRPCLWLHAVSVGEVLQLRSVLSELQTQLPGWEFVISTTTSTGHAVAEKQFSGHRVCYFPLDFSWSVRRALTRTRPSAVVLVELELWPNFILAVAQAGIPLMLINGRISQHSYCGYRLLRPLIKRLLERFARLAVQTQTYADRFVDLGASADCIQVTGSIKFDRVEKFRQNEKTQELRHAFGLQDDEKIFIAGSTQAPEEQYALQTWLTLVDAHPDLRLILVPRHQERFEEVARLVTGRGLPLVRRSQMIRVDHGPNIDFSNKDSSSGPNSIDETLRDRSQEPPPVLLLDTLGELSVCWGLADIAFVGGSLTNRGGQNMIEPAAYGATVLFGPNTKNFRDVVESLLEQNAAQVVSNAADLTCKVQYYLDHPLTAREQGRTAQRIVLSQQGATAKTVAMIMSMLHAEQDLKETKKQVA